MAAGLGGASHGARPATASSDRRRPSTQQRSRISALLQPQRELKEPLKPAVESAEERTRVAARVPSQRVVEAAQSERGGPIQGAGLTRLGQRQVNAAEASLGEPIARRPVVCERSSPAGPEIMRCTDGAAVARVLATLQWLVGTDVVEIGVVQKRRGAGMSTPTRPAVPRHAVSPCRHLLESRLQGWCDRRSGWSVRRGVLSRQPGDPAVAGSSGTQSRQKRCARSPGSPAPCGSDRTA